MKRMLKSLIDSLMVFGLMLGTGFVGPFMDDRTTDHSVDTEG